MNRKNLKQSQNVSVISKSETYGVLIIWVSENKPIFPMIHKAHTTLMKLIQSMQIDGHFFRTTVVEVKKVFGNI